MSEHGFVCFVSRRIDTTPYYQTTRKSDGKIYVDIDR